MSIYMISKEYIFFIIYMDLLEKRFKLLSSIRISNVADGLLSVMNMSTMGDNI